MFRENCCFCRVKFSCSFVVIRDFVFGDGTIALYTRAKAAF